MSEENTINQEMLEIIKALSTKIENLEKAVYNKENLLMKSGFVISNSPTPVIESAIGGDSVLGRNVADMEWSDIHKMVSKME